MLNITFGQVRIFATIRHDHSIPAFEGESLTTDIERTISDLERQREAIDRAISALREVAGSTGLAGRRIPAASTRKRAKRTITPEGKARIAEAQRKRWAEKRRAEAANRGKSVSTTATGTKKQRRAKRTARKRKAPEAATAVKTAAAGQV
jgi:hypothetical protein